MTVLLRDLLDRHIEAVLLENARLVCERERCKAGPSRDADADLYVLRDGWCRHQESGGCSKYFIITHDYLPLWSVMDCVLFVPRLHQVLHNLCRTFIRIDIPLSHP